LSVTQILFRVSLALLDDSVECIVARNMDGILAYLKVCSITAVGY
jgi:hypothetical protein